MLLAERSHSLGRDIDKFLYSVSKVTAADDGDNFVSGEVVTESIAADQQGVSGAHFHSRADFNSHLRTANEI